jgi:hypothetical protein
MESVAEVKFGDESECSTQKLLQRLWWIRRSVKFIVQVSGVFRNALGDPIPLPDRGQ